MSAVTVTPVLPCAGCAHLAVCAIRPLLDPIAESADVPGIESPHEAIRISIDLRVDCSHFLGTVEPASPVPVPVQVDNQQSRIAAAALDEAPPARRQGKGPEPSASRRVDGPAVVPARSEWPLGPPMAVCDPGCGNMFTEGLLGAHRRECESYAASRAGKVRDVGHRDGPAPLSPASVEAIETAEAENERFAQRRQDAAREAADRTWAERHDGIERPLPAERAQPGTTGLTANQERVVDAIRACGGDQAEAARRLGLEGTPARLYSAVQKLRKTGRLPADVAELLDRRKAAKGRAS